MQTSDSDPFKALAEPIRREILQRLATDEMTAGDIASHFDVTRPAVSRHLRTLREANLVTVRPLGTARFYSPNLDALARLRSWFDAYWDASLPKLKRVVESAHGNSAQRGQRTRDR